MILKINRCGKSPIAHHAMRRGDHEIREIFVWEQGVPQSIHLTERTDHAQSSIWRGPGDYRKHVVHDQVHDQGRCAAQSEQPFASRLWPRRRPADEGT